jgi:sigma-B regulation protein RsbU (phosphoserine phosphatase)
VDPGVFLGGLNEGLAAILERAETTMFATAFFGVIDLTAETFSYACAGHPGPIVEGRNGVGQIAVEREQKGSALGLVHGSTYPTNTLPLAEIKRLILFTDGILEPENHCGEPFFEQRLMDIVSRGSAMPVEHLLDDILSSVLDHSQHRRFDDDVCLLAIEVATKNR